LAGHVQNVAKERCNHFNVFPDVQIVDLRKVGLLRFCQSKLA